MLSRCQFFPTWSTDSMQNECKMQTTEFLKDNIVENLDDHKFSNRF